MHRVMVTGLGPVSNIGIGWEAFAEALWAGKTGLSPIRSFDTNGFPYVFAGEVHDFEPRSSGLSLDPKDWGRSALFAAAAGRLAARDADLDMSRIEASRVAVVMGTTCGESQVVERLAAEALQRGPGGQTPALVAQLSAARIAHAVSEELGAGGESVTLATACSASNYSLGYAFDKLQSGAADVVIAGGAESVCRWAHAGFYRLGALAEQRCMPFDKQRQGMLTAEGGSALVLETEEHARARGATPYAEVLGYGLNCDARHMVSPDADSIAHCMRIAHGRAGLAASDVDYICAHGTGTAANDLAEAAAIREVFGAAMPPVSSIKSMIGHSMGAASGFGAIASVLSLRFGMLPPTVNWSTPDPELCGIDTVPRSRRARVRVVQNNGFAFGGNNAILLLGAVA
jgi:3-oxoacyl-[acyl-carrier-protein] synthase II